MNVNKKLQSCHAEGAFFATEASVPAEAETLRYAQGDSPAEFLSIRNALRAMELLSMTGRDFKNAPANASRL